MQEELINYCCLRLIWKLIWCSINLDLRCESIVLIASGGVIVYIYIYYILHIIDIVAVYLVPVSRTIMVVLF